MKKTLFLLLLLPLLAQGKGLKDTYRRHFLIGVALNTRNVNDDRQLIIRNFNSVTCENAMKPAEIHPAEGRWNFREADSIANFCRAHGIKMRGHTLLWHAQFADWMYTNADGTAATREEFLRRLHDHILTVVSRYKDVVYAWDVANECVADGGPTPYRDTRHYRLLGLDALRYAFRYAREADPNALLFYNDYNAFQPAKRDRIYNMVRQLKEEGTPIDGIGLQGHYNIYGPDMALVDTALTLYSTIVPHIHITELDIRLNNDMGGALDFQRQAQPATPEQLEAQKKQYRDLFRVLKKHRKTVDCVTFWNLTDRDSWVGPTNQATLFDTEGRPKPVYDVVNH